jgi:hypothetical protein
MNSIPVSISSHKEPLDCPRCGTAWRLKRGLCLSCLLSHGLDAEMHNSETLDDALDQIEMRDADWRPSNFQILEEIGRGATVKYLQRRIARSQLRRAPYFSRSSRRYSCAQMARGFETAARRNSENLRKRSERGTPVYILSFSVVTLRISSQ